jgi:predicted nucleotidyltransferase
MIAEHDLHILRQLCLANEISRLALFGSVARNEATPSSDVDLIADLAPEATLLDMVRLEREFSEALHRQVDLLTEESISPYIFERIRDDLRVLYEKK